MLLVLAGMAAGALILWLVTGSADDAQTARKRAPATAKPAAAEIVTPDQLAAYAATLDHPVYWSGARDARSIELTRTADGGAYVRYLPPGTAAGDRRPLFLTIGTYPRSDAFAVVRAASAKADPSQVVKLAGGGLAVPSPRSSRSVYFATPSSRVLVEVFSPDPARSLRLVRDGAIVPVR